MSASSLRCALLALLLLALAAVNAACYLGRPAWLNLIAGLMASFSAGYCCYAAVQIWREERGS